jgi:hypothetical protein
MDQKQLIAYAQEHLGHEEVTLEERRGSGYSAQCSCGYRSARRGTQAEALRACIYHLENAARTHFRDLRTSGASVA